jgi:hypothetical protein
LTSAVRGAPSVNTTFDGFTRLIPLGVIPVTSGSLPVGKIVKLDGSSVPAFIGSENLTVTVVRAASRLAATAAGDVVSGVTVKVAPLLVAELRVLLTRTVKTAPSSVGEMTGPIV